MTTKVTPQPAAQPPRSVHRFTIAQYERLVKVGFLGPGDRAELIDGWLVDKMPHNPPHAAAVDVANEAIGRLLRPDWTTRSQLPIRLSGDNAPEPDVAVVRAPKTRYFARHPAADDIALVVEVADSSLEDDRRLKTPVYARAKLAAYWIIDLNARRVEVYTSPRGGKSPTYRERADYAPGDDVPVVVGGTELGRIPVAHLLPAPAPESALP